MNVDQLADDAELVSRWLGRTINNKYTVQDVVGNGGMAVVYSVKHRNGKRFALKMLHRELSLNPFIRQRFVREGYVANRVEHEGAVAVIDDDITDDGSAFLVMELLHGVTLEHLWDTNGNRLTLECVLAISEQLLDVLAAAHAQNIVHRDLKPANVFVTRKGIVKILDFGIARLREGDGSKTESGTTLGTPLFMPPEQASGRSRDVDGRTDLWAVGATMFSALSGQYVHDGENAAQVLIKVATTPARSLATVLPNAPHEVVALIDKALAFHNEDRWNSAAEMRAAVLDAQARLGLGMTREALGQIVRVIAPASASTLHSTPITPPGSGSGSGPTERLPSGPHSPPHGSTVPHPEMNATKRSALGYGTPSPGSSPAAELTDSSARAMTSPTMMPSFRPKSGAVIGGLLIAALAVAGALLAVRFAGGTAEPATKTPLAPVPIAAPLPGPAPQVSLEAVASAPPVLPVPPAPEQASSRAVAPEVASVGAPAQARPISGAKPVRKPVQGGKPASDAAAATIEEPAPVASPAPVSPTPTLAPASSPTANGTTRKPPPVLDRTSPFGN